MPDADVDKLKRFMMTNQLLEHDLDQVETDFGIDLKRGISRAGQPDASYYPQIESAIRAEAARIAPHYEVFYSLEKTIRSLISESLEAVGGLAWWGSQRVPDAVRKAVESRRKRDIDTGMTLRSEDRIDFTTFGELGQLISGNWDVFGGMFSSVKAVERVMANLNSLRGPIAHCSPLAEDEVVRLQLTVRVWFRLME
jgi:hypothetical protein